MKETLENNKMIAMFMGWVYTPWQEAKGGHAGWLNPKSKIHSPKLPQTFLCRSYNDLKYDSDWNWLMRVVEKIETIKEDWQPENVSCSYTVKIRSEGCTIRSSITLGYPPEDIYHNIKQKGNKLNSTYFAVVEFIQWYNNK